jgi:hypothetical protein
MRRIAAKGNRRSLRAGGSSGNRFTRSTYDRGIVGQCLKVMAMATVREGSKGVLVVVDVQVGVMNEAWDAPRVIGNVARAVERARAQGVPVIWVQHSSDELPHGSPQWQWCRSCYRRRAKP